MTRLAVAAAFAALLAPTAAAAQTAPARMLVVPFDNVTRENRIVWLGEAAAVLLADNLNALGASAITREERRRAFEELQVLQAASLTDATVIRIGQIVGAAHVVVGTLRLEGNDLVVQARAISLETGRVQSRVTDKGPVTDLFAIFERVARRMVPPAPGLPGPIPPHPPVAAFENYVKGLLAETPVTAINYQQAVLQADPSFDRARLALWEVYDGQGEHALALAAASAVPVSSPLSRRARFFGGLSQLHLQRHADAFAAFRALADERTTPSLLNNLGVVQLRRGGSPASGTAVYYFNRAAEADQTEPDFFFNLGYAYLLERETSGAIYWLREAVRRDPTDGDAHYLLGLALTSAGTATEANREMELARRLSSSYAEPRPAGEGVPKGLERIADEIDVVRVSRVEEALASGGQRDQQELARFYLDRGRRLYQQEQDREALTELSRVVFLSPYQAEAHLLIGRIHLRGGRVADAIDAFKISLWSADSVEAHAALAEAYFDAGDREAARGEATRALTLDPASAPARAVIDRLARP